MKNQMKQSLKEKFWSEFRKHAENSINTNDYISNHSTLLNHSLSILIPPAYVKLKWIIFPNMSLILLENGWYHLVCTQPASLLCAQPQWFMLYTHPLHLQLYWFSLKLSFYLSFLLKKTKCYSFHYFKVKMHENKGMKGKIRPEFRIALTAPPWSLGDLTSSPLLWRDHCLLLFSIIC